MENNKLSRQFTTKTLLLYALPTILMMIFMSSYTTIDGIFVSEFVGENALAAINIVYPAYGLTWSLGLMFATGANAIIGKFLGEKKEELAKQFFTLIYLVGIVASILLAGVLIIFIEPILELLKTSELLYPYAKDYLFTFSFFIPMAFLQVFTQTFFISAGKPILGFVSCLAGGITNIILDYVFLDLLSMGISGAAIATGLGFCVPGIFGIVYFAVKRNSPLCFVKPKWEGKRLLSSVVNGSSEFVTNVAASITTFLFNAILLDLASESGVTSITVILYVQMLQAAIYGGYSFGVSSVISYKYGSMDKLQLQKITRVSFRFIAIASVVVIAFSFIFADFAVSLFVDPESSTYPMTLNGFRLFAFAYIFMGFNIFTSTLFTSLSNGKISALLSILRTLVFTVICLLTLPNIIGINGVWLAVPLAEALTFIFSMIFYKWGKSIYHYSKSTKSAN